MSSDATSKAGSRWGCAAALGLVLIFSMSVYGWFGPPPGAGGLRLRLERTMDGKWVLPQADGLGIDGTSSGRIDAICSVVVSRAPGWIRARGGEPSVKCELMPMANGEVGARPSDAEVMAWWAEREAAGDEAATSGSRSFLSAADRASLLRVLAAGGKSISRGDHLRAIYALSAGVSSVGLALLGLNTMVRKWSENR